RALLFSRPVAHRHLHSFPTRRSSDLFSGASLMRLARSLGVAGLFLLGPATASAQKKVLTQADWDRWRSIQGATLSADGRWAAYTDRKSTRLNSSHVKISYAVFCLKKK